jgi:hypothetical protein
MFNLTYHHRCFTLTELENMYPYERDMFVDMLTNWLQEQAEEARRRALAER